MIAKSFDIMPANGVNLEVADGGGDMRREPVGVGLDGAGLFSLAASG